MRKRITRVYNNTLIEYILKKFISYPDIYIEDNDKYNYITVIFHWFNKGSHSCLDIRYKYSSDKKILNKKPMWRRK